MFKNWIISFLPGKHRLKGHGCRYCQSKSIDLLPSAIEEMPFFLQNGYSKVTIIGLTKRETWVEKFHYPSLDMVLRLLRVKRSGTPYVCQECTGKGIICPYCQSNLQLVHETQICKNCDNKFFYPKKFIRHLLKEL